MGLKLIIDVGNTNIKFAVYEGFDQRYFNAYQTKQEHDYFSYFKDIYAQFKKDDIEVLIYVSVVPSIDSELLEVIKKEKINLFEINTSLKLNIKINDVAKKELGNDLLCLASISYEIYKQDLLAISLGTASAIIHLEKDGSLKHCLIFPGLKSGAMNLFESAEKLCKINLEKPDSILALDTKNALRAGITYAYIGSIKYIVEEYRKELGTDFKVVVSGGFGKMIEENCEEVDYYDRDLVIKGAMLLYEKNK